MLNLRCIGNAPEDDKKNELDVCARLFKAKTWEEIKMIANQYDFAKEAANSIYAVSADEAVRLQCEARERYERDWASSYKTGFRAGVKEGVQQEKDNTDREKKRADEAEARIGELEEELRKLKASN